MVILYLFANAKGRAEMVENKTTLKDGRYSFYAMDEIISSGRHKVLDSISFEASTEENKFGKFVDYLCSKILSIFCIRGGSFYKIFRMRKYICESDCVVATADRVGIPLVFCMYFRIVPKRKIIYISIGLPERLSTIRSVAKRAVIHIFRKEIHKIICYGNEESIILKNIFEKFGTPVHFVSFGIDTKKFFPQPDLHEKKNVVCVGDDVHRDYVSLFKIAKKYPDVPFLIITSVWHLADWNKRSVSVPDNVQVHTVLPFHVVKRIMSQALFFLLPVHNNSYSGATTTFLQAMAYGKAVVLTKTGAIDDGYHLVHNHNILLVEPNNLLGLEQAFVRMLEDKNLREILGKNARETALNHLDWSFSYPPKNHRALARG